MTSKTAITTIVPKDIQNKIYTIRGVEVMIDRDLAELYQVETKALNQAVKRNTNRFPERFRFQLSKEEKNELVTNCDRFNTLKHSTVLPYAFTEQGVSMLASVLKSNIAVQVSIQIIDAFVNMRKFIQNNRLFLEKINLISNSQFAFQLEANKKFEQIFKALESHSGIPKQGIFFEGQIFDAYVFVSKLIKQAKKSIELVDNYIDESVLTLLTKCAKNVTVTIYTKEISKKLQLDLKKHNEQYPAIEIKLLKNAHDRFLILDSADVYHIGASIKDLGKKWFGFSKFDKEALEMIRKLKSSNL